MKTFAVAAVLFCVTSHAGAQTGTVTGTVVDHRTDLPIQAVLIYLEGQSTVVTTDADGRFALGAPLGRQTIVASVIGYALLRADVDVGEAPTVMTIRLSAGAGAYSDRVDVSGSLRGDSESVPGAISLHGRELEVLRGAVLDDPLRAIQSLPSATATDDFYSEFAVRGNPFHRLGLVVDGVPARHVVHAVNGITDGGSIAMINSETLGSVTLLPGSYPQRTGRRLGAEIDLTTREGQRDRFHGRAGLSGTSATFLGEGPLARGKGSWLASIRRSYLDYVIRRIDPEAGFAFGFVDVQTRITYDLTPRHQVSFTALAGRAAFQENDPDIGENGLDTAVSQPWMTAVAWRYSPSTTLALTHRLYSTGLSYDNDNRAGERLDAARHSTFGWRVDAMYAPRVGVVVDFGGDAERLSGRGVVERRVSAAVGRVTLNDYRETATAASVYGQLRLVLGERLTVTPGLRVDRWTMTRSNAASPWLNVEFRLSDRMRVRGGSGVYRQFAEFDEVLGIQGGGDRLRPERSVHLDLGFERSLSPRVRVVASLYARRERDVLFADGSEPLRLPDGTIRPGAFNAPWRNALSGRARGVEVVIRRDAPEGFTGWFGYALGRLRYTEAESGAAFWADADQRHTITAHVQYRLSSRASVSGKYRYGSNYPLLGYIGDPLPALGIPPVVDGQPLFRGLVTERNTHRLPFYSRLDVRADRAFKWSSRRIVGFVEVANVLNRTNHRNTSYGVDRAGRVFGATESLMPIVPSAGLVVEF